MSEQHWRDEVGRVRRMLADDASMARYCRSLAREHEDTYLRDRWLARAAEYDAGKLRREREEIGWSLMRDDECACWYKPGPCGMATATMRDEHQRLRARYGLAPRA